MLLSNFFAGFHRKASFARIAGTGASLGSGLLGQTTTRLCVRTQNPIAGNSEIPKENCGPATLIATETVAQFGTRAERKILFYFP